MERVYCKKDVIFEFSLFNSFNKHDYYIRFHKGKYYKILEVEFDSYWIKYIDHWGNNAAQRFQFDSQGDRILPESRHIFSDYFYTLKELRKEKILRIDDI